MRVAGEGRHSEQRGECLGSHSDAGDRARGRSKECMALERKKKGLSEGWGGG